MEIGIRLHDTAGSNLEEHLRNAKEQGFSCVHIAMSKVVPGFKMADAPELLTDALADEVRGLLEKYNQRCVQPRFVGARAHADELSCAFAVWQKNRRADGRHGNRRAQYRLQILPGVPDGGEPAPVY